MSQYVFYLFAHYASELVVIPVCVTLELVDRRRIIVNKIKEAEAVAANPMMAYSLLVERQKEDSLGLGEMSMVKWDDDEDGGGREKKKENGEENENEKENGEEKNLTRSERFFLTL